MDWFTVPNLINALIAVGIYAARSELSHIKTSIDDLRTDIKYAHKRIDEILSNK
jgi:hypothetical protein